ncbi:hypothetical protein SFRURICE_017799 [Spodoptera frugiperda]|nr:hypothetical protein SFRURICE_017799 [Spodoptera frugiperda]
MSDCVCELCGYTFVGDNGVRAHKRLRHKFDDKNQPLKGPHCEVCDIKFLNRKAYSKHLRLSSKHLKSEDDPNRLSNDPSIKTRRLDKSTVPVRRTRIHRREDIDMPLINGTVTCEQCGVECGGVRAYSRHFRRAHPGLLPAQCNTQVTPYMCEHCGKMFMNTTTLEGHMWVHTGQKRFQCDHCHKTFSMKSNLAGHMKQHEPVRASFACQLCGKLFAFNHNLTRHLRCDHCNKTFSMKSNLAGHMKQHEPVRASFACQLCGKLFAFNHNLTRHLRCDHCHKTFSMKSNLAGHMKQHEPVRASFACQLCGKLFAFNHNLTRHLRCDHCHKTFSMKSNLAGHMKQHEPVRASFACQLCGKLFAFNHNLTRHLRVDCFPKEVNLRNRWVEALGMGDWEPRERSSVCSEHFRVDDFYETRAGMRRIRSGAVPMPFKTSEEDLDEPAAMRVCRICLAMDTKMYNITESKLDIMFQEITGLVGWSERLPQRVCWECAARLSSAYQFREKAIRSDELLQELIQPDSYAEDIDLHIQDYDIKTESIQENMDILHTEAMDIDVSALPTTGVEIKDESSNGIFFDEYDHFDDEDDRVLSEVYVEKKEPLPEKKKRVKLVKKVSSNSGSKKSVVQTNDPYATSERYKTNDVKRRRSNELDESLFTITPLTYDEQIEEVAKRQQSTNYTSAPYKCVICYRGFLVKGRYTAHAVRHSEQSGTFECFICKTRLKTSRALRKHLTSQHTEQYSCNGCSFVTRNRGVAREHQKWHAGHKYQCPHCASEFDKLTTYLGHIRIKHVSDIVCEICGYMFVSKKGVEVHKKKKHHMSGKNFASEEAHDRHLKLSARHSNEHGTNHGHSMRRNERRPIIHPRTPRPDDDLESQSPVTCEQSMALLKDHMWVHTGVKRFKCDRCTKSFTQKTNLIIHMKVHSGTRPSYECPLCGKHFAFYNNRRRHMFIHTGLKPFKCDTCGKCFTSSGELKAHVEHVHLKKPWPKRARQRAREWKCDEPSIED